MSSVRNVALSGLVGAIIAIGLIAAVILTPGLGLTSQSRTASPLSSPESSTTGTQIESEQGNLAVLLTDPPTVPANVSAVYISYDEVQAHIANAGNETGWYELAGSGQVNLMGIANASETIANQSLPEGKFNGLRFNITSILVTYEGQNETALMISGHNTSYIWVPGGIMVNALETAAAMIDYTPTVLMAGNVTNPVFVFVPAAVGYVIPNASIPAESYIIGTKTNLNDNPWWLAASRGVKFGITSVVLTPDSLSITVVNQGESSVILRFAAVTTGTSFSGGFEGMLATSDVFVVDSDSSLSSLVATNTATVNAQVSSAGYLLSPGQSVTLHYSGGSIILGAQQVGLHMEIHGNSYITAGQFYHVLVQGGGQLSQAATQAVAS